MRDFEIGAVIVCDDIRMEKSNKHILIGVYGGDIVASQTTGGISILPLSFYIEFIPKNLGQQSIDIRVELSSLGKIGEMTAKADVRTFGTAVIPFGPVPIQISGATSELTLSMRINGGRWRKVKTKTVRVTVPPSAAGPPAS